MWGKLTGSAVKRRQDAPDPDRQMIQPQSKNRLIRPRTVLVESRTSSREQDYTGLVGDGSSKRLYQANSCPCRSDCNLQWSILKVHDSSSLQCWMKLAEIMCEKQNQRAADREAHLTSVGISNQIYVKNALILCCLILINPSSQSLKPYG